jgi:catechol 2,3-dioxygenase-like lactoylglutathione lyase family enzyme
MCCQSWSGSWDRSYGPAAFVECIFVALASLAVGYHRRGSAQAGTLMTLPIKLDHSVIHVSDWERSNAFYRDVLGAELVRRPSGWCYRFGDTQLNLHGPGFTPAEVARLPVQPGNSDLCFEWKGPIADAIAHLDRCKVAIHRGPVARFGAKGPGTSVYFRDPDGSLLEFISYDPGAKP